MFKVGDKIRCNDNSSYPGCLTLGKVYEVTDTDQTFVYIIDDEWTEVCYDSIYFELAESGDAPVFTAARARSITENSSPDSVRERLEEACAAIKQAAKQGLNSVTMTTAFWSLNENRPAYVAVRRRLRDLGYSVGFKHSTVISW